MKNRFIFIDDLGIAQFGDSLSTADIESVIYGEGLRCIVDRNSGIQCVLRASGMQWLPIPGGGQYFIVCDGQNIEAKVPALSSEDYEAVAESGWSIVDLIDGKQLLMTPFGESPEWVTVAKRIELFGDVVDSRHVSY